MKYCPRCGDEMPELTFRTKPTVVKSEAEKHVDMAVDTIVDLGSEVKKVAEEYKKVAEDIFGFTPKGRESAKSTPPQAKAPKSGSSHPEANKSDSRNSNATEPDRTVAHSEMENGENTGSAEAEDTKGPGVKSKTQTRKKTKIAKSKKQIKGKKPVSAKKPVSVSKPAQKKNAPATKKPKPQPKAKAKKKSRPKT